eukprot:2900097-Lingulodinium_polyedra.AAC.1
MDRHAGRERNPELRRMAATVSKRRGERQNDGNPTAADTSGQMDTRLWRPTAEMVVNCAG